MGYDAVAAVTSKLEDAIDKVLEATATIAQFSKRQFEEYVQTLAPARVAIYVTLQAIYADHPDLRPKELAEPSEDEPLVVTEVPKVERAFDDQTVRSLTSLLSDAHRLVGEAQAGMRFVAGVRRPLHDTGLPTLDSATEAIQAALARLRS